VTGAQKRTENQINFFFFAVDDTGDVLFHGGGQLLDGHFFALFSYKC
jgi:hypothetical protein